MNIDSSYQLVNYIFLFIFGLLFGSFLNVVIFRMGSGRTIGGRSKCMSCGKVLKWYMLIPIFSFIFQKGRCAYCRTKLSMQYPVVELTTGLVVLMTGIHYGVSFFLPEMLPIVRFVIDSCALISLIVIAAYDLRHKIIPDQLSIMLAFFGLLSLIARLYVGEFPSLMPLFVEVPRWLDFIAAPAFSLPIAAVWYFSRGRAMGLGDAKLIWGASWLLGFIGGLSAIIFAFWIAVIPSIIILVSGKGGMKTELPFGPFLALAIILVYFFDWNILYLSFSFITNLI